MSAPLAFLAFDYMQTEPDRVRFVAEKGACSQPFEVEHWSAAPRSPRQDWNKVVHSRIGRCDFMIVLVAAEMDRTLVAGDILEAKRCNVPFFGVYVDEPRTNAQLPDGLNVNRAIPWDWDRIAAAIAQVTREGKHYMFR